MNNSLVVPVVLFFSLICSQAVLAAPINLSKSDGIGGEGCVSSGGDVTYRLCYSNPNVEDLEDVILTDTLPDETTFQSASNDGQYDANTRSVTWDIGLLVGEGAETCVQLTIKVTADPGSVLTNQAEIGSGEERAEVEEGTDVCPVPVSVDIKPGSCPNPINVRSKGVLPVAVLGTVALDINTIDPGSITLAGVSPLRWSREDVATPYRLNTRECTIRDCHELKRDGFTDLTLKFDSQEIYAAIGEVYDRECLILELKGNLKNGYKGLPIKGGDVVSILKKGKKHQIVPANALLLKKR